MKSLYSMRIKWQNAGSLFLNDYGIYVKYQNKYDEYSIKFSNLIKNDLTYNERLKGITKETKIKELKNKYEPLLDSILLNTQLDKHYKLEQESRAKDINRKNLLDMLKYGFIIGIIFQLVYLFTCLLSINL